MKFRTSPALLAAIAAVAVVSGCAQLHAEELVDGVDGKKYRIDSYGLDASLDRGGCSPEGKRLIEVNLKNNSRVAYISYEIKDDNLKANDLKETTGEIPPSGSKKIVFTPEVPTKSVSATVVQLRPEGIVVESTRKIQGLEARPCS